MMRRPLIISVCTALVVLLSGCEVEVQEQNMEAARPALARVNGEPIYPSEFKQELLAKWGEDDVK